LPRKRGLGVRVLKAVSSPVRLGILRLLFERGPLSYTEIMNLLKFSPSRDAGRFAYHLKTLLRIDLIEPDVESRKYRLTDLGRAVVGFADELDESTYRKKMLVRTSRFAIENFDRSKIAESLVREAGVPTELAQKIARETEKRLLKLNTKYLTAPLIREFVNAILIERGLEEYRHKLTRLGLPVYDVTSLIKTMSAKSADVEAIHTSAGNHVIREYTLLNVLPRDVADAHLSGALNLNNLGCWILKISSVMHDLRFFFRYGIAFKGGYSKRVSVRPPKSLKSALSMVENVLGLSSSEVSSEQGIDFFNVFLAPYIKGLRREEIKEELRIFLTSVNLTVPTNVSLGLDTVLSGFLAESKVFGPDGKVLGVYSDYSDESLLLAHLVIECLEERGNSKPLFNPSLVIKVHPETLNNDEGERLLYEAHSLAVRGLPYFANLCPEEQACPSYTATGSRLAADWRGDWELDTIRTGCMDWVTLNLPRALYDARRDRSRFFENVYDCLEKALRALEMKYLTIRQRARRGLLPFLIQRGELDPYYRHENSPCLVSFVGLNEAAQSMIGEAIHESGEALNFAEEVISYLSKVVRGYVKKRGIRYALSLRPDMDAARRLAELDIERYGLARVRIQGDKDNPFYTNMAVTPYGIDIPLEKYLSIEERFHALTPGGHLVKIPVQDSEEDADHLLSTTREIVNNYKIGFYTYDRSLTYCGRCGKTFYGELIKCPTCGSASTITQFSRESALYKAKRP
jgi:ribonucleoside-triphosphate reductase